MNGRRPAATHGPSLRLQGTQQQPCAAEQPTLIALQVTRIAGSELPPEYDVPDVIVVKLRKLPEGGDKNEGDDEGGLQQPGSESRYDKDEAQGGDEALDQ
jgi:hypothetical protein